jgi:hypothetical protein
MATDQLFTAEPPRRGGCGRIFFLGSGCGCLIFCILCCGVVGSGVYTFSRMASVDPVRVVAVRQGIADLEVPEEFTPQQSFDLTIPVVDRRLISWVVYEGQDDESVLVLAEFGPDTEAIDLDELIQKLHESLEEQGSTPKEIAVEETEKHEMLIRGKPAELTIARGRPKDAPEGDDRDYWLVTGTFAGHQGRGVLLLIADAAKFDREKILKLLDSIR